MSRFAKGFFNIKHPEKYAGKGKPKFRSSWEFAFMSFLDNHPGVVQWASESIYIPYKNPLTGRSTVYIPDFFVIYIDKNMQKHAEVLEIKPAKEAMREHARSRRDKAMYVINMAKWTAAAAWCKKQGMVFRVLTEQQLFHQGRNK